MFGFYKHPTMIGWIVGGRVHQKSSPFIVCHDGYQRNATPKVVSAWLTIAMCLDAGVGLTCVKMGYMAGPAKKR